MWFCAWQGVFRDAPKLPHHGAQAEGKGKTPLKVRPRWLCGKGVGGRAHGHLERVWLPQLPLHDTLRLAEAGVWEDSRVSPLRAGASFYRFVVVKSCEPVTHDRHLNGSHSSVHHGSYIERQDSHVLKSPLPKPFAWLRLAVASSWKHCTAATVPSANSRTLAPSCDWVRGPCLLLTSGAAGQVSEVDPAVSPWVP